MDELRALLASSFCIIYTPLKSEVPVQHIIPKDARTYTIPCRADLDPLEEAKKVTASAEKTAYILVPGTSFDASGTRHGRGGGWYDRFLSQLPKEWVRVGVCSGAQFSNTPLTREPWDEPMDYVCVVGADKSRLLTTNARS